MGVTGASAGWMAQVADLFQRSTGGGGERSKLQSSVLMASLTVGYHKFISSFTFRFCEREAIQAGSLPASLQDAILFLCGFPGLPPWAASCRAFSARGVTRQEPPALAADPTGAESHPNTAIGG
jgi:hypothetical protein